MARRALRQLLSRLARGLPPWVRGRFRLGSGLDRVLNRSGYAAWRESVRGHGGVRMVLDTDEPQQQQIYWTGIYDRQSVETIAETLPDGGVLIDVGAGVGSICLFAVVACANLGKAVRVHAFEPMGLNHHRLIRNAQMNGLAAEVSCHRLALGAAEGTLNLCYRGGAGAAAVVQSGPGIASLAGAEREEVPVVTLDDWSAAAGMSRLDVLKVDIEGAEPLMFRGAMKTIDRFRPVILAEFNHWWAAHHGLSLGADCFDPLWDLGYQTYRRHGTRGRWEAVRGHAAPGPEMEDTMWMPPDRR